MIMRLKLFICTLATLFLSTQALAINLICGEDENPMNGTIEEIDTSVSTGHQSCASGYVFVTSELVGGNVIQRKTNCLVTEDGSEIEVPDLSQPYQFCAYEGFQNLGYSPIYGRDIYTKYIEIRGEIYSAYEKSF